MCRFKDNEIESLFKSCSAKKYSYVIVQTLIGDDGFIDAELASKIPDNVISIYSKNIKIRNSKIKPIPIGRDWRNTLENNKKLYVRKNFNGFKNIAYLNFSVETCKEVRKEVFSRFSKKKWVTTRMPIRYGVYPISHSMFLEEIHEHKFCFSPVGKALDCYRTWDTLFVKSIPIVDNNQHVSNYKHLPILFTSNWKELNSKYLESKYFEMLNNDYDFSVMFTSYWQDLFHNIRKDFF